MAGWRRTGGAGGPGGRNGAGRALFGILGITEVVIGAWALAAPAPFYRSFPGAGWHWAMATGPYNEHFVRDFGGLSLALAVLTVVTALTEAVAPVVTALVWEATAVPHLAYHAAHLEQLPARQDAASLASLAASVVVPLIAAGLMWSRGGRGAARGAIRPHHPTAEAPAGA